MSGKAVGVGRRKTAAILVTHREGEAAAAVQLLNRHFTATEHSLGLFEASVVADGAGLEGFMRRIPADADTAVVHLLPTAASDRTPAEVMLGLELEAVEAVGVADQTLRTRFPALRDVDSWVVVDLGRTWSDSAIEVAQALLDVSTDVRLRGVVAVTGSTAGSVAGDDEDRLGMLIDVAWDLATSPVGDTVTDRNIGRVWAVGSRSFTLDTHAWIQAAVAPAIVEAIDRGPLRPAREGVLDQASVHAESWLKDVQVGTAQERADLMTATSGSAMDELTVRRHDVASVAPADWASMAEQEYLRLSGAPLSRFTRVVQGNARDRLEGRPGSPKTGLRYAFDEQAVGLLRSDSGCLRSARFLNAVAARLAELQSSVASAPHPNPSLIDLEAARRDLDAAVRALPGVFAWLVRILPAVLVTAVIAQSQGALIAAIAPVVMAAVLALGAQRRRTRVVKCRDAYIAAIEAKVQGIAWQRLLAAEVDMIKGLQAHVGAFTDDHDVLVDMEAARPPAPNTRAADLRRIWQDLTALRDELDSAGSLGEGEYIRPRGMFFRSFPATPHDVASLRGSTTDVAKQARAHARQEFQDDLADMQLHWDRAIMSDQAQTACESASSRYAPKLTLDEFDPHLLQSIVSQLGVRNDPAIEGKVEGVERCILVMPPDLEPETVAPLRPLANDAVEGADRRRLSVLWWSEQNFRPNRGVGPDSEPVASPEPTRPPPARKHGSLVDGGGV